MHILLVDDEPTLTKQILADYGGYSLDVATNGQQAIEKIATVQSTSPSQTEKTRYDLIILDINMPILNGWQTLQMIRNNPQTADTYIIMLTSDTEESSLIRGLRRGADDYLMKPLSPSRLLAHIAAIERRLEVSTLSASNEPADNQAENNHAEMLSRLTQREKELLKLVVQGLSNQQLAEKMIISETTVKNHLASIYRKWDVSNRNQAAFIAQQLKL